MTNRTGPAEDEFLPTGRQPVAVRSARGPVATATRERTRTWLLSALGAVLVIGLGYLGHTMATTSSVVGGGVTDPSVESGIQVASGVDIDGAADTASIPTPEAIDGQSTSSRTTAKGSAGSGAAASGGGSTSPDSPVDPDGATDPRVVQATDSFSVMNVPPRVRILGDFAGGAHRADTSVQLQMIDDNLLAGARMELCLHEVGVSCAERGARTAVWTVVVTNDAPIVTPVHANGGWALDLRSRTGSAGTPTATYGFGVTIGATPGAGDWQLTARILDDGGLSSTATGAPASVTQPAQPGSSFFDEFITALWPY